MTDRLDRLWAGWRAAYLAGMGPPADGSVPDDGCVFCNVIEHAIDSPRVIATSPTCIVLMNAFPYNNGHMLVLPRRHVDQIDLLERAEVADFWDHVTRATTTAKAAYSPHGVNVGVNEGAAAGAGIPEHLHAHVLPRWMSDTTFTTTIAATRVIPEDLDQAAARLRAAWV